MDDPSCGSFLAAVAEIAAREPAESDVGEVMLSVGQTVEVNGTTVDDYNGMRGTITGEGKDGRWGVLLDCEAAAGQFSMEES